MDVGMSLLTTVIYIYITIVSPTCLKNSSVVCSVFTELYKHHNFRTFLLSTKETSVPISSYWQYLTLSRQQLVLPL
jgi:hypothetical protein